MKKNKAFTLIELLAVIVILAIIALIAVPVVVNIINDSKKSSEEESLKLYEDAVQKMIVKKQMQDPSFNPSECKIKEDGNLECTVGTNKALVEVEVKGTKPNKGTVAIKENKISLKNVELNGKIYYETYAKLVNDVAPQGLSIGDKYTYKVNDKDTFTFYVLSIEDDKVNLIMDRNICEDGITTYTSANNYCLYVWYARTNDNTYGPIDAMITLGNGTRNWTNVPNMNLEYDDIIDNISSGYTGSTTYGYRGITIINGVGYITNKDGTIQTPITLTDNKTIKARLPREDEVTSIEAGCHIKNSNTDMGTCNYWLVDNLYYAPNFSDYCSECVSKYLANQNNGITNIYGYWILSSYPSDYHFAHYVGYSGDVHSISVSSIHNHGIRPVITVSKSDL